MNVKQHVREVEELFYHHWFLRYSRQRTSTGIAVAHASEYINM